MSASDPDEAPTRAGGSGDKPVRPKAKSPETEHTMPSLKARPDGKAGAVNGPAAPAQQQDPLVGVEIGGCRIEEVLGRGAMGAVYRSKQLRLDREVAVKVIRPELMADQRMLQRFEVEARMVGRFNSPHVVMVHDVGFERGVHFLVIEFVRGKNLRDYVKLLAGGRMQVADAIPLLRQACRGLEEAQRLGVLHRDIKPDNLMLTDRGVLKIADFGIAKPMHEDFSMTLTSELIGTPLYMSPEQCHGAADLDFRSDMYSLGATFYYLLTGEPPIRASSVYELIQTKTKLEHLSLWKTLPELDENHPLSRVIEKMTALDRSDRYESYEALLGDLVLVQQGRTMEIKRPPSKQQAPPKKSGRAAGIAAVVVLGLGAGGWFAWQEWGPEAELARGPKPPLVVVPNGNGNVVEVGASLTKLRERLAAEGPMKSLRQDVVLLTATGEEAKVRETLLADIDQGLLLEGKLKDIEKQKPAKLELPFTDLRQHFDKVSAAVVEAGTPCPELKDWVDRAAKTARAEAELSAGAVSALVGAFSTWQIRRSKAGGDEQGIADLGKALNDIDEARRKLLEILPDLQVELQEKLSVGSLEEARRALTAEAVAPVAVDLGEALAAIRKEFTEQGPIASLQSRLGGLKPTMRDQVQQRANLLNEFQRAGNVLVAADRSRVAYPEDPRLPFDDVANFFAAVDRELLPLLDAESGLPVWAQKERDRIRDAATLQAKVLKRCRTEWANWQQRSAATSRSAAETAGLEADLSVLKNGITKARELFPQAATELEGIVSAEAVAQAATNLGTESRRQQCLVAVREVAGKIGLVESLGEWRVQGPQLAGDLVRLRTESAEFASDVEVARQLERAEQAVGRWRDAESRVAKLGEALGSGDLLAAETATLASPSGKEGSGEFKALVDATSKSLEALTVLDQRLDIGKALAGLTEAKNAFADRKLAPGALARLEIWISAVQAMQRAADGMVPIAGGRTKAGDDVPSFFLSRTETKQSDFQRFIDELQALLAAVPDPVAQLEALKPKLGDLVLPPAVLAGLLSRNAKPRFPSRPIDSVCWYEAAACARWFQQSLPTAAEWSLAALGSESGRFTYPFGNEWKDDDKCRNIGNELVDADSGGLSWRSRDGVTVHHLAGNAAEWLQLAPGATEGRLAGGRYNDTKKEQTRRAAGEDFHSASLTRALPGFGFRTILRVRDYLAPSFKDGRFPARK